jgi:hypothetical protein
MPQLDTAKTNRVVKWMQGYPAQEHLQSMSHARIAKLASGALGETVSNSDAATAYTMHFNAPVNPKG